MVQVIMAVPHGFCGGVQRAIDLAKKAAGEFPGKTYLLREIVHNLEVVRQLEKEFGVKTVQTIDEIPDGAVVVFRSHGVKPEIRKKAEKRGLKIFDGTCPLVAQVHKEVRQLAKQGKKIIFIASDKNHDEAIGVAGEAPEAVILTTLKEISKLKINEPENSVVLTQTTLSILETKKRLERLKRRYPQVTIKPHICAATTQRQKAVMELAKKIGFVIIVGSATSSNSKRLREVAEAKGAKAYLVNSAEELNQSWFQRVKKVAVSSGASTPEWLLEKVIERIKIF